MDLSLAIHPLGWAGDRPALVTVDPAAGQLIKAERKTVVWQQTLPDGTLAVLKLYRHRNPSWLQRRGWERGRAQREYDALRLMESRGIACSPPLFWAAGRTEATGQFELLATRLVPDACDLAAWLREHPDGPYPDLVPAFALIAKMHRAGLQHGALLDRNILYTGTNFRLIDMPRSRFFVRSIAGRNPGLFDLRLLVQSLSTRCPEAALVAGLAGYPLSPADARALVQAMRPRPLTNRRLNRWIAVYTVLSGCSRLFYRQA
jgi:tRNA A-37 threonylcarbamoyl transferase component Bud32